MKIDSLRFKNINSLKGEWSIDFDQSPLVDAGVFAITGPNGAGKTSILDAITLGLYGETFKFDHPSAHVMTKQTDESFAEVVFSWANEQFRSSWSVERKDGKLTSPEMQIVRLDSHQQVLAEESGQVRAFIADLTGLDFRRFTRSIVLAQGDFAAFLNALDNERMDILEKIVGGNIYEEYKQEIVDKAETDSQALFQLEQVLSTIKLKSPAEIEALEHDLIDFKDQESEYREQRDELDQFNAAVQEIVDADEEIADIERSVEQVQSQMQQLKTDIAEVTAIQDFSEIEQGLATQVQQQQQFTDGQETLSDYRDELVQLQTTISQLTFEDQQQPDLASQSVTAQIANLDSLKSRLSQLKIDHATAIELSESRAEQLQANQATCDSVTTWIEQHEIDRALLNEIPDIATLKRVRNEIVETKQEKVAYAKKVKTITTTTKKKDSDVTKLQSDVDRLKKSLEKQQTALVSAREQHALPDLEEDLDELQAHIKTYKGLVVLASDYVKVPKAKGSSFLGFGRSKAKANEPVKSGPAQEYETVLEQQEQTKTKIDVLAKAVDWEARLQKQADERKLLVDGECCSLCGSTEHPFTKNPPETVDSTKALAEQKKQIITLDKRAEKLVTQIKSSQTTRQVDDDNDKLRTELKSYWLELCTRINRVGDDFTIEDIKIAKSLLADKNKAIKECSNKIIEQQNLQQKIDQQQISLEQKQAALVTAFAAQKQNNEADDINPQEQKTLDLTLADNLKEEQEIAEKLIEELLPYSEKVPAKGKEDKTLQRLQTRQQDFQEKVTQQEQLQQDLITLAEQLTEGKNKIQQLDEYQQQCSNSLHASEVASLHLAMVEKQKLIVDKEQALSAHQQQQKNHEQQFNETLKAMAISNADTAQTLIDRKQQIPEMEQQILSDGEQVKQLSEAIVEKTTELKTLQDNAITTLSMAEIVEQQKQLGSKLSIAIREIRSAESILAQQASLQNMFDSQQEQVLAQQSLTEQSQAAAKQLENESVGAFRRRVQQVMIGKLMNKSNQFLETINDRYCIHQRQTEHGLAVEIEDKEGTFRAPQTLSGGESFVISLSLALGLSGMASEDHSVESLFLDEGFGTLDEETLYVVLSTLESLRHSGKRVGVISHVKELKERIRTQIRVSKALNGHSSLEVVS